MVVFNLHKKLRLSSDSLFLQTKNSDLVSSAGINEGWLKLFLCFGILAKRVSKLIKNYDIKDFGCWIVYVMFVLSSIKMTL